LRWRSRAVLLMSSALQFSSELCRWEQKLGVRGGLPHSHNVLAKVSNLLGLAKVSNLLPLQKTSCWQ